MNGVIEVYRALRAGHYTESLSQARELLKIDPDDFYTTLAAAIAAASQGDTAEFQIYRENLNRLNEESPYSHYINGYAALNEGDVERSLWHYTRVAHRSEGWLARHLIEKLRTDTPEASLLRERAAAGHTTEFLLLPGFLDELEDAALASQGEVTVSIASGEDTGPAFLKASQKLPVTAKLVPVLLLPFLLWWLYSYLTTGPDLPEIPGFIAMESGAGAGYIYPDPQAVASEFRELRQDIHHSRINQAIIRTNRLLNSNTDFRTRERARIMQRFIREADPFVFANDVSLQDCLEKPVIYRGVYILLQGRILGIRNQIMEFRAMPEGRLVQLLLPPDQITPGDISEFKGQRPGPETGTIAFARFQSVIGGVPVFQALRTWD